MLRRPASGRYPTNVPLPPTAQKLSLEDNHLNGTLPTWTNLGTAEVYVQPGNDGLCGAVSHRRAGRCGMGLTMKQ